TIVQFTMRSCVRRLMRDRSAWFVTCAMGSIVVAFYAAFSRDHIDAILSFRNQSQTGSAVLGAGSTAAEGAVSDGDAADVIGGAGAGEFKRQVVPPGSPITRRDPDLQ